MQLGNNLLIADLDRSQFSNQTDLRSNMTRDNVASQTPTKQFSQRDINLSQTPKHFSHTSLWADL